MKFGIKVLAAILAFGIVSPAFAADKPAADKPAADKPAADKPAADKPAGDKPAAAKKEGKKGVKGAVVRVDGDKLVIKAGKKGEEKEVTVATTASTKITLDGKEAKLADLKEGHFVSISPADGSAETITVMTAKPAKKEKTEKTEKAAK